MLKIFFVTFFLAELIIAFAVILKIYKFNKKVNKWNNLVSRNKQKIKVALSDFRVAMEEFSSTLKKIREFISLKRQEYLLKVLKTILPYVCFFMLKSKYKKGVLAYQVIKEIYDGYQEA